MLLDKIKWVCHKAIVIHFVEQNAVRISHTMKELLADKFYVQLEGIRKGFPIRGVTTVEVIAGIGTKIYCNCSCFFPYNLSALYTGNSHFCGHRKDHESVSS